MSNSSDWRTATKSEPCPICGKPDYCGFVGPEGAIEIVRCMRIESDRESNGGWIHRLRESTATTQRTANEKPQKAFTHAREAVAALERQLGPRSNTWTYLGPTGDPVGLVLRWDQNGDKTIRPVARIANGWVIGAMPEPRPLYQLPELVKSSAAFVNEGEKAADAIRSLRLCATTSAGGSAAAAKTDWSPLAGKQVVILPDNDPPGEKYCATVLEILATLEPTPTVSVLRLPNLPEAGDAADWINAGGTAEQLEKLVEQCEFEKPKPSTRQQKKPAKQFTELGDAAQAYIDRLQRGETGLISLGIPELDYALGGGVEKPEVVLMCARPSHGKSALALQTSHRITEDGKAVLMISEEMSKLALGKRTLQWASSIPLDRWSNSVTELERDLADYKSARASCIISEPCGTIEAVVESIERAIEQFGIECVVIDYAQLLKGKGNSKYEQVSHVSNTLREVATRLNLLMIVLCQLNREIEKRSRFIPTNADIRDSGSLEQDADVILLLAWPHKVDPKQPPNQYQIFISKNRNRAIHQHLVVCRFDPSRQTISESTAREHANYCPEFDDEPSHDPFN